MVSLSATCSASERTATAQLRHTKVPTLGMFKTLPCCNKESMMDVCVEDIIANIVGIEDNIDRR